MTKKQRSFLFFLMLFLFFAIGPSIVLYSQGYRIDFENKKVVQTGAFYFMITPKSVRIEIDSISDKKTRIASTDFLFGTSYVENLLPGRYKVKILKQGYHDWEKILEINERMATEIKNVTLIPENPEFEILKDNVENFFFMPDNNKIIFQKSENNDWKLSLYEIKNGLEKTLVSSNEISREEIILSDLIFSDKSNRIIMKIEVHEKTEYYLLYLEEKNKPAFLDLGNKAEKVSFHPQKEKEILFQERDSLLSYNYETKKSDIIVDNIIAYSPSPLYWLSKDGFVFRNLENPKRLNKYFLEIKEEKNYEIHIPNLYEIMIKEDSVFYLFDKESEKFKEVFHSSYKPFTSPDFQKMVHFTDNELRIFFLEDIRDQPARQYKENVFLTRFSDKIREVDWYTSHYLIFTFENEIKITEINNSDHLNIVTLIKIEKPQIFFNLSNQKLYILSENKFFTSKRLIP